MKLQNLVFVFQLVKEKIVGKKFKFGEINKKKGYLNRYPFKSKSQNLEFKCSL